LLKPNLLHERLRAGRISTFARLERAAHRLHVHSKLAREFRERDETVPHSLSAFMRPPRFGSGGVVVGGRISLAFVT
jgi:hypothetical protein